MCIKLLIAPLYVLFVCVRLFQPTYKPTKSPTKIPTKAPTKKPTFQPTNSPSNQPTKAAGSGPQFALYDSQLSVPACSNVGISCDSGQSLILGRAGHGPEPNTPNSLDSCEDGGSGSFHDDESIDRVIIKTNNGSNLSPGVAVTIEATVYAWDDGSSDYADFYYASDASNPNWVFIATKAPAGGGLRTLTTQYNLPSGGGSMQAVRVNFRYKGTRGSTSVCMNGNYNDVDDLAFKVA